jgi:chromosome segregation ATPase
MLSSLEKYLVIGLFVLLLIGGGVLYVKYTSDKMAALSEQISALNIQAKSLQAANESLKTDIASVQEAQADTYNKLEDIRVNSNTASNQIRNRIIDSSNPAALEKNVNEQTAAILKALQDLSARAIPKS